MSGTNGAFQRCVRERFSLPLSPPPHFSHFTVRLSTLTDILLWQYRATGIATHGFDQAWRRPNVQIEVCGWGVIQLRRALFVDLPPTGRQPIGAGGTASPLLRPD